MRLTLLCLICAALPVAANTLYVDPASGDDAHIGDATAPLRTIRQALSRSVAGTQVHLAMGVYSATTGETFPLAMRSGVALIGAASTSSILLVDSNTPALVANSLLDGATVTDLTLLRHSGAGPGIRARNTSRLALRRVALLGHTGGVDAEDGMVDVEESLFELNRAQRGGGLRVVGALRLVGSTVRNNIAESEGGGLWVDGPATLLHSTIAGNIGQNAQRGGGLTLLGEALLEHCVIRGNTALGSIVQVEPRAGGGGVFCGGPTQLHGCVIENNTYRRRQRISPELGPTSLTTGGGGLAVDGVQASLHMTHCVVRDNTAEVGRESLFGGSRTKLYGGGMLVAQAPGGAVIEHCTIERNALLSTPSDGVMLAWGGGLGGDLANVQLRHAVLRHNRATEAGGVYLAQGVIEDSLLAGNQATNGQGGGVRGNENSVALRRCHVLGNLAAAGGGVAGCALVDACRIEDNTAFALGGGLFSAADMRNNLVLNNHAPDGGGAFIGTVRGVLIVNNTFHGNTVDAANASALTVQVLDVRIINNVVTGEGPGAAVSTAAPTLLPVLWNNNLYGYADGVYLVRDQAQGTVVETFASADALNAGYLQALGNRDAEPGYRDALAMDLRPAPGSALIDAGTTAAGVPSVDILGATRPQGLLPDVGAYEFGGMPATPTPTNTPTVTATPTLTPTHSHTPTPSNTPTTTPTSTWNPDNADINGDGRVDALDLLLLIRAYHTNDPAADLNGSGRVDHADLFLLQRAWQPSSNASSL